MKWTTLRTKVLPSLLAGTSRHPLPGELIRPSGSSSDGALETLSLMGQALRFERPSTPDSFIVEAEIKDERKIVADASALKGKDLQSWAAEEDLALIRGS